MREDYLRVTEIITPFTGIEFAPQDLIIAGAQRGTEVHQMIEGYFKGFQSYELEQKHKGYMDSFKKFWEDSHLPFDESQMILEKRLFCDELKITGKPDVIIPMGERTYILDWKTSSSVSDSWRLQSAAYRYLCEKAGYLNVDNILFVKVNKDGKPPTLKKYETYLEDLDIFKKCLELYKYFKMDKTRKKIGEKNDCNTI